MLAPDSRAALLDLLRPPVDFEMDQTVATTFTLDLSAALIPPLAFVARGLSRAADQLSLLAALRTVSDRIDIFCQAGQIAAPRSPSRLIDFVAPMLHPVREPKPGHLFHAKLWFVRYVADGGEVRYRLLVPSRNLTGDASWDAVVAIDGEPGSRRDRRNDPLAALVAGLPTRSVHPVDEARTRRIADLADEIQRVTWTEPDGVREIAFHVFGLPKVRTEPDFSGYRQLIVSPFLTAGGVERVRVGQRSPLDVVSRPASLDALGADGEHAVPLRSFIVSPQADLSQASDGPDQSDKLQESAAATAIGTLHAKMICVERARLAHLFLGSLNVTDAAFTGNVEVMVELVGPTKLFGVEALLGSDGFGAILEPYELGGGADLDPVEAAQYRLDEFLRVLAASAVTGEVTCDDRGYSVRYRRAEPVTVPDGYTVTIELYTRPGAAPQPMTSGMLDVAFGPMPLVDVTPFLTTTVTGEDGLTGATVLVAALVGDPEDRLDAILAAQLDTPAKFLQFLAAILGLDDSALFAAGDGDAAGFAGFGSGASGAPAVFELLVRALVDKPEALDMLATLIPRLTAGDGSASALPDGFAALWESVGAARKLLAKEQRV